MSIIGLVITGISFLVFIAGALLYEKVNPDKNPTHPIGCVGFLALCGFLVGMLLIAVGELTAEMIAMGL